DLEQKCHTRLRQPNQALHVTGQDTAVGNETRVLIEPRVVSLFRYPNRIRVVSLPCRYFVTLMVYGPFVVAHQLDEALALEAHAEVVQVLLALNADPDFSRLLVPIVDL